MPDALVAGGATFVALATVIISLFASGKIVAGSTYDRQCLLTDRLAAALEKRNDIDEAALNELRKVKDRL